MMAILFSFNLTFGQQYLKYTYTADTVLVSDQSNDTRINRAESIAVRFIDNARNGRIYFNPKVALTDAELNVVDEHGDAWLKHSFAVLSDLDISVKNLPEGNYELIVSSDQGSGSISFQK